MITKVKVTDLIKTLQDMKVEYVDIEELIPENTLRIKPYQQKILPPSEEDYDLNNIVA